MCVSGFEDFLEGFCAEGFLFIGGEGKLFLISVFFLIHFSNSTFVLLFLLFFVQIYTKYQFYIYIIYYLYEETRLI